MAKRPVTVDKRLAAAPDGTIAPALSGPKLRTIRALRGITQAELAERAGVTQTAIAEYETGKRDMRGATIRKLCDALGVKVQFIIDGTEISGP